MNAACDEEVALARRASAGDKGAEDELIVRNLPLVKYFAARFRGQGVERDDLIGEGSVALVTAVRLFDASRGVKLSTYLGLSIYRRMARVVQKHRRETSRIDGVDVATLADRDEDPVVHPTDALDRAIQDVLTGDESRVLQMEVLGLTKEETARESGKSRRQVRRVRRRAIAKLRNRLAPAA